MSDEFVLSSPRSDRVKRVAALASRAGRKKQGLFLAEGPQPVREALKLWLTAYDAATGQPSSAAAVSALPELDALFFTPEALEQHADVAALLDQVRGVLFDPQADIPRELRFFLREVTPEVLKAMSDADTPQGVLAVCRIPRNEFQGLNSLFVEDSVSVNDSAEQPVRQASTQLAPVLLGLQDPGNVGTLIRTADAAGAQLVILGPGTVDPWSPKVVRSGAGSHFHLPIFPGIDAEELTTFAADHGLQMLAADGYGEASLHRLTQDVLAAPTLWLLGNEAHGLSEDEKELADTRVAIPLFGQAESLNVSTAGAVCLYASATAQDLAAKEA